MQTRVKCLEIPSTRIVQVLQIRARRKPSLWKRLRRWVVMCA